MKFFSFTLQGKTPWQITLRGAAIPGMIVGACTLFAMIFGLFNGSSILSASKIGIALGLFFSLYGGIEIVVVGILFSSKDIKTNSLLALGYLIVWGACLFLIFGVF